MKLGNLTQESPSSVGADKAPTAQGQLVTQPIPEHRPKLRVLLGSGQSEGMGEFWLIPGNTERLGVQKAPWAGCPCNFKKGLLMLLVLPEHLASILSE
jgi:hypothetical protein